MKRMILILAAAVALAGCGSSGSKLYTLASTKNCLVAAKLALKPATDFVATTATGGSTRVIFADNSVTLVLGLTQEDADNINAAYQRFHGANVGIADVLRQDRNAVMLWKFHPADTDAARLVGCLKS